MHLTIKQTKALDLLEDDKTNEVLFGGGAGGGKSVLGCYWILKNCFKYPGTRWLIGRSKLKNLKETTLNTFWEVCKQQGIKAGEHFKFNSVDGTVTFVNGSQILLKDLFLYPSDPQFDGLGSLEITGAFVDECNQIVEKSWNIVKSRIRYRLDEYNLVPKMLGSCNPAKSWVYPHFYKPSKEGTLPHNRAFIQSLLTDNPHISKHYRENLLTLDKASKARLLMGDWEYDDDPSALINYESILDCFTNNHVPDGTKYITADIARFGSDNTVIVLWSGYRADLIQSFQKSSISNTAELIRKLANTHAVPVSRIIADEDGVGGGVVDILRCKGFVNNSSPLKGENYANLKSQCYFKFAERVNAAGVFIKCDDPKHREMIIEEMEQVKQKDMDKDGKKSIVGKEHIKDLLGRSPDFTDALMMREFFNLDSTGRYAVR